MKQYIIDNFLEHATAVSALMPGQEVLSKGGLSWVDSGLQSDTFNVAFVRQGATVDSVQLSELQSYYQERNAAFCLWLPEEEQSPALFRALAQHQISRQASALGMGLRMTDYDPKEMEVSEIEAVRTPEQLLEYASVIAANWSPPDQDVLQFYTQASAAYLAPDTASSLFIYRQAGQVVSTIELFAQDEQTAGIYGLSTLEASRRQGIGTKMMSYIMYYAWQAGYENLILHASEAGAGIYQRLGFRTYTHLYEYT